MFDPWVRKILWRRKWQPNPVFLPGESQTEKSGGLQPIGSQRVGPNWSNLACKQDKLYILYSIWNKIVSFRHFYYLSLFSLWFSFFYMGDLKEQNVCMDIENSTNMSCNYIRLRARKQSSLMSDYYNLIHWRHRTDDWFVFGKQIKTLLDLRLILFVIKL